MKKFWHLAKFNIIFNKVSIGFLTFLSLVILSLCYYFFDDPEEYGGALMQYSFYVMFMIFTGKMNAKNSMMFDIKHLAGLPLSNTEIVFMKSLADTLQLAPIASVFLYGFSLAFPEYHTLFAAFILLLGVTFGNVVAFNKRIDFSRMQHSKASFKNSFLYLHKYLEMFIQIILAVSGVAIILGVAGDNIFWQEYGFFVFMIAALALATFSTLKMLRDETRSYFIFKRDTFRIAIKLFIVGIPLFGFHVFYKSDDGKVFRKQIFAENAALKDLEKRFKKIDDLGNQKFFIMLASQEEEKLKQYIKDGKTIPWDTEVMGHYPMHVAVVVGNKNIINILAQEKPEALDRPGKFKKRTPLYSAIKTCNVEMIDYLVSKNVNLNHQEIEGNTPLHFASDKGCYAGVVILGQAGADPGIKNKKGKDVYAVLNRRTGLPTLLKQMQDPMESEAFMGPRLPASTKTAKKP